MKKIFAVLGMTVALASITGCHHAPATSSGQPTTLPAAPAGSISTSQAARSSGQMTPEDRKRIMQQSQGH